MSKYTVVCIKHFQECDIIKYDILPGKNGDPDLKIPQKKFALQKDAFPCIFPNLCSYLSTLTTFVQCSSPSKPCKRNEKYHKIVQEQWLNTDKITLYESFLEGLNKHLLEFRHSAIAQKNNDYVLLYHTSFPVIEHYPFLKFLVLVHKSMNLDVWFRDIKLDFDNLK